MISFVESPCDSRCIAVLRFGGVTHGGGDGDTRASAWQSEAGDEGCHLIGFHVNDGDSKVAVDGSGHITNTGTKRGVTLSSIFIRQKRRLQLWEFDFAQTGGSDQQFIVDSVRNGALSTEGGDQVSDVSQGEGWWKASDGKWYSPDRRPAPQAGWWKASDGKWYPPERKSRGSSAGRSVGARRAARSRPRPPRRPDSDRAPAAPAGPNPYGDAGVPTKEPGDLGAPAKQAKPWWQNPKVSVPLGVAAVVIIVVAVIVATTNHSNAYPASVRSEFLKGCDSNDGGGAAQAAACNCFLNWLEANRPEAQTVKADESTIAADVAAAQSSCPNLVYSNSGSGNSGSGGSSSSGTSGSGGSSGNSGSGGSSTSGNSGSAGSSTSGNSGSSSSGTSGNTGTGDTGTGNAGPGNSGSALSSSSGNSGGDQ